MSTALGRQISPSESLLISSRHSVQSHVQLYITHCIQTAQARYNLMSGCTSALPPAVVRWDPPLCMGLSLTSFFSTVKCLSFHQWVPQWNGTIPPTDFWQTKLVADDDIAWLIIGQQCTYCEARKNITWWWQAVGAERINCQCCFSNEIYWPWAEGEETASLSTSRLSSTV